MRLITGLLSKGLMLSSLLLVSQYCMAEYVELDPPFVVNLADERIRFAQVSAQVRVEGDEAVNALSTHYPAIRHALVMLLSTKSSSDINSREGKEQLRSEAVEAIRKVLEEQHVKFTPPEKEEKDEGDEKKEEAAVEPENYSPIQDIYFTRFIIQ